MNMEKKSTIIKVLITVLVVATLVATMTFALTGCSKNEPMQTDPTTQTEPSGTESTDPKPTDPQVTTYTVTFKDHDGTVLKTETVEEGKAATAPADPTREGYTFEGWDKTFDNVTADMEVTATYKADETKPTDPQVTTYTVTFKDYDGKVLKTQKVESGKSATAPANPTRTHYTFIGWDKDFDTITSDLVVTATYKINKYTVTFKDYDGKVLKTEKVESGKAATAPADPTRAHYTFTGWDKDFDTITSNLVVTATYKINEYTVTFQDYDGKVLKTEKVESGKGATAPADPAREHYTFTGWDKTFNNVTSDLTVTATYKINEYTVTFKDYDGKVLKTQKVESGKGATAPADPAREHYTFTGWDKTFNNVTSDLTVTATYKINEYTVTFKDYDGKVLKTQKVESGKVATAPADPTREHYTFAGWDKTFNNVTSDLTVTATYKINEYTVTFKDYDGKVLKTEKVESGKGATAPADPTRTHYTFTGWDKAFNNITSDLVITATYKINQYTVTFKDYDGTVLKTQKVESGKAATAPANPTRTHYTFTGWDKAFNNVTSDLTVTATYKINEYTVTFKDYDGKVLKTEKVESGKGATAPADPTRTHYTFTGWDKAFNNVTSDLTVTATYKINEYTVTFKDYDGKVLKTQKVERGKAATAPADPTRTHYTFTGWDKAFDNVTSDLVVTATYKINEYTVTFKDYDGTVLKTQTVERGKAATAPADPTRTHYTFTGWDKAFNKITADLVVTATYKINEYTVTFKDYDGTVLKTQKVESGKAATAPADPTRTHYTFTGWDKAFNNVTSDLVITATYKINQYTVTFKDYDGTVLKTQKVESGKAATAPADPTRTHYTFTGWDKAFNNVTSDLVITATYKINQYTVTFKDYDGTVLKTQTVERGKAATAPADPTRTHYTFTGWDKAFNNITSDLVIIATYKINQYTVTFKDYDGTVLKTQTVESGKAATAPADPTRENYKFAGWDKAFNNVTSDLVVTATYSTTKLIISAESVMVNKGTNEVTMKIRVTNNPGIMGAVLKVSVNDDVFAFASADKTGYSGLTLTAPGSAATSSPYTFMLDSLELSADDKKDGTLFTITFKIKDTSATGKYDVKLSCNKGGIFDENYNDLDVTFVNGTITIQ